VPALVLIVDDHFDNRSIYRSLLTHLGYEVVEATDGNEAIEVAHARQPQVILMDMSLPGRDGWSATRALKDDPATAHIPVIALTAHVSEEHRDRARVAGCDAYIPKPVVPRVVAETIRQFAAPDWVDDGAA
jgi:two-component system cell cycle response regulator DivK